MCAPHYKSMPLIVLNMGGEMVYILEQRLTAQKVPKEKADRGGTTDLPKLHPSFFCDFKRTLIEKIQADAG